MSEVVRARVVADSPRCELGESPVWDERLGLLSWLDITGRRLHRRDATGAIRTTVLSEPVTSIGLTDGDHLVGTRVDGFASIDPCDGTVTPIGAALGLPPGDRMNDGGCDPAGRYWAGSMNTTGGTGTASLWRLERDGRVVRVREGLTESNGLAWPSDEPDTLYHVDTPRQRIELLSMDASGTVRARTTVAELEGAPDGLSLDADGNLWVALWGTGRVRQLAPDGTPLREVRLPATSCSNTAFFRDDNDHGCWRLAITTAREDVPPDRLDADDFHGALFVADVPAAGVPAHRFHG